MENKVIQFKGNVDMKEKIKQAAQKAEADFKEKVEMSRRPDVDVREIFSAEEIDELYQGKIGRASCRERVSINV